MNIKSYFKLSNIIFAIIVTIIVGFFLSFISYNFPMFWIYVIKGKDSIKVSIPTLQLRLKIGWPLLFLSYRGGYNGYLNINIISLLIDLLPFLALIRFIKSMFGFKNN